MIQLYIVYMWCDMMLFNFLQYCRHYLIQRKGRTMINMDSQEHLSNGKETISFSEKADLCSSTACLFNFKATGGIGTSQLWTFFRILFYQKVIKSHIYYRLCPTGAWIVSMVDIQLACTTKMLNIDFLSILSGAVVEEIWEHTSRELRSLGLGTGRVNRNIDAQLAKHLGIRKLPDFVGVIGGKVYHYSGAVTVRNLKEFVSELFPNNLVSEVSLLSVKHFVLYITKVSFGLHTQKHNRLVTACCTFRPDTGMIS